MDDHERQDRATALAWIDSAAELCRIEAPATPPQHLVAYIVVQDRSEILLVDHIKAGLWLPPGGHVDPQEHPRATAARELFEELGLDAAQGFDAPLFLSISQTVGLTAGHTDVSLWYVIEGDRRAPLTMDRREFRDVAWFARSHVPLDRSDPQMRRFLTKLA